MAELPENISREDVLKAIAEIDKDGIRPRARSSIYDLLYRGKRYPPKYVVSIANKYANGEELDRSTFSGGQDKWAAKLLKSLGFTIVTKQEQKEHDERYESTQEVNSKMGTAKNQILYGPPGTGKTYHTVDKALEILDPGFHEANKLDRPTLKQRFDELKAVGQIDFVTFHQSFSYEDFVEGLRASTDKNGQIHYKVEDGIFKRMCDAAAAKVQRPFKKGEVIKGEYLVEKVSPELLYESNPQDTVGEESCPNAWVLIIDEINRGNIANIFGELITLIEPSKRTGAEEALEVTLPYSKDKFSVPDNLYIIGTMNTADRSLVHIDTALRRRFQFEVMLPDIGVLDKLGMKEIEGIDIKEMLRVLNSRIELLYDKEHTLGHSFFLPLLSNSNLKTLSQIFRNQILPLLEEYFFEDWGRIQQILGDNFKSDDNLKFYVPAYELEEVKTLLGSEDNQVVHDKAFKRNEKALQNANAFRGIYRVTS